jgi:hypothetical protein
VIPAAADLPVLRRVLEETRVDQTVPTPGWSGYAAAVAEAFFEWLRGVFPRLPRLDWIATRLGWFAVAIVGLLVLLIVVALLRMAAGGLRRPRAQPGSPPPAPARPAPERDRGAWRAEVDRRLAAADVAGALEALWWWFARSISAARVDPAWTSQELLAHCGRRDLAPFATTLDRLLYGSERPGPQDVRGFLGRLEAALP